MQPPAYQDADDALIEKQLSEGRLAHGVQDAEIVQTGLLCTKSPRGCGGHTCGMCAELLWVVQTCLLRV